MPSQWGRFASGRRRGCSHGTSRRRSTDGAGVAADGFATRRNQWPAHRLTRCKRYGGADGAGRDTSLTALWNRTGPMACGSVCGRRRRRCGVRLRSWSARRARVGRRRFHRKTTDTGRRSNGHVLRIPAWEADADATEHRPARIAARKVWPIVRILAGHQLESAMDITIITRRIALIVAVSFAIAAVACGRSSSLQQDTNAASEPTAAWVAAFNAGD